MVELFSKVAELFPKVVELFPKVAELFSKVALLFVVTGRDWQPTYAATKGVGPGLTLAWPGWKQPDIPVEVDTGRLQTDVGRQEF